MKPEREILHKRKRIMKRFLAIVLAIIGVIGLMMAIENERADQSEEEYMLTAILADRYYTYPDHIEICSIDMYGGESGIENVSYTFTVDECSEIREMMSMSAIECAYNNI